MQRRGDLAGGELEQVAHDDDGAMLGAQRGQRASDLFVEPLLGPDRLRDTE